MKLSDTPMTDALQAEMNRFTSDTRHLHALALAERLERDRAELLAALKSLDAAMLQVIAYPETPFPKAVREHFTRCLIKSKDAIAKAEAK